MGAEMDMIEKVARAIWDDACPGMEWGDIDRLSYRGWAQAAIEAMREPTDAMKKAGGWPLPVSHSWSSAGEHIDADSAGDVWVAMIDAVLGQCTTGEE